MAAVSTPRYASLGMYPFDHLVGPWEDLWSVAHRHAPWTPVGLAWTGDVPGNWRNPTCLVAHASGWPVAAKLPGQVEVVGAFTLTLPGSRGHEYRSVLVARDPGVLARIDSDPNLVAAANSRDSLSGWVGLLAAVQSGEADRACIDALSLAHIGTRRPDRVAGLHQVGHGPWIPSPAVVVRPGTPPADRALLVEGLQAAVADPAIGGPLGSDGFVELDAAAYEPTLHVAPDVA